MIFSRSSGERESFHSQQIGHVQQFSHLLLNVQRIHDQRQRCAGKKPYGRADCFLRCTSVRMAASRKSPFPDESRNADFPTGPMLVPTRAGIRSTATAPETSALQE